MTIKDMPSTPELHLPEGLHYTCHQSGMCCPVFPRIPVEDVSAERLRALDFSRIQSAGCSVHSMAEAVVQEEGPDGQLILRRKSSDGSCVFYGEDKLCSIHKTFGEPAKPQVCRDFPYRYRVTPGGVFVGLSFVCPSVRGNKGQAVVEQQAELAEAFPRAYRHEKASGPILLSSKLELSWEQYVQVERGFTDLLGRTDAPLHQRLIGLRVLIEFLEIAHQQARGRFEPMAPPRRAGDEILQAMDALRQTAYEPVLRSARRPVSSPMLQRMFLGMLTSFANTMWEKRGRAGVIAGLLGQYARHSTGIGRIRLQPLTRTVSHRTLARVGFPVSGPAAELLNRYLGHCVFRKDLLLGPSISRSVNLLLVNAALLRWYAAGNAFVAKRSRPTDEDFSEAVRYVETYYGAQSKFYRALTEHAVLEELVESFTQRKNYPYIIMGEPEH